MPIMATFPSGASASLLPGSRPRGLEGGTHLWPNPVPLECGVIRLLEKQRSKHGSPSAGGAGGQKFPTNVSWLASYFD